MRLRCFQYRFPFAKPFQTSNQVLNEREGVILVLEKDGITAMGEAAPLPGFSRERLPEVKKKIRETAPEIIKYFNDDDTIDVFEELYDREELPPSLCFGIDTLWYDFTSQRKQMPLRKHLFNRFSSHVAVNAVTSLTAPEKTVTDVENIVKNGFRTLKAKVGSNFEDELSLLKTIRDVHPNLKLRIDANRSWSLDEARKNLNALAPLNIEYCEEPLANPSPESFEELTQQTSVPIALDESLADFNSVKPLISFTYILVIKPMVTGRLSELFRIKRLADTHGTKLIFTSSLESGIGRLMTANLASGLGAKQMAHGLATGNLLTMDVWHDGTYINSGYFILPDHSGLGQRNRPDIQNLAVEEIEL